MKAFVTGGTGLFGNTILRQLTGRGVSALSLVRNDPAAEVFDGIDTELIRGNLFDRELIDDAVSRCDVVIHSAGIIHLGWTRLDESMRVNRDAVKVLADACIRHNRRFVLVGSVNTLATGTLDSPSNESTPITDQNDQTPCVYVVSKRVGVEEFRRRLELGLKGFVIHPGYLLGPWDWKPSSGRMVVEIARKPVLFYPLGGCSVCDARDVAAATIRAIESGRDDGREYVLAGENMSYRTLWTEMALRLGRPAPRFPVGRFNRFLGSLIGDLKPRLGGREGDINSASIQMSKLLHYHDSTRARNELNYTNRPISQTLNESVQWINDVHLGGQFGESRSSYFDAASTD